jgi:transcriptional regulator with XRE-family HTH domain
MSEGVGLNINQRVKVLRKELHLTQREFAKLVSVSQSLINSVEQGKRLVNDRLIGQITSSFNVDAQWLKTGRGDMYNQEKDSRIVKLLALFSGLKPQYQEFVLNEIFQLLKMQDEEP